MKTIRFLTVLIIAFTSISYSQDKIRETMNIAEPPVSAFKSALLETASYINGASPAVTIGTLRKDMNAVEASLPAIKYMLEEEFNNREIEEATLDSWQLLRKEQLKPNEALTPKFLINYVTSRGKLTINSVPSGANIEINGKKIGGVTDIAKWMPPGSYTLQISKPGYRDFSISVEVFEGKKTSVAAPLAKK